MLFLARLLLSPEGESYCSSGTGAWPLWGSWLAVSEEALLMLASDTTGNY